MKKGMWSLLLLIIIPALAFAQQSNPRTQQDLDLGALDWPSASTENLFTPLVNPSLLGTENSSGFGWHRRGKHENSESLLAVCQYEKLELCV